MATVNAINRKFSVEDRIKIANEHVIDGISLKKLSKKYNVSVTSICKYVSQVKNGDKMYEHGTTNATRINTNPFTVDEKIKIANEYIVNGKSKKDIALQYNCSVTSVHNYITSVKNNLPMKQYGKFTKHKGYAKIFSHEEKMMIGNEYIVEGISKKDLALKYNCCLSSVNSYVNYVKANQSNNIVTNMNVSNDITSNISSTLVAETHSNYSSDSEHSANTKSVSNE